MMTIIRIQLIYFLLFHVLSIHAQTKITINPSIKHQVIEGFGASDAWSVDFVGKYWTESQKEAIAKLLFSQNFDKNGKAEGAGLSRWRFNIGAGSAEQGDSSNINDESRRSECFLKEDSTYDWNKQAGQQWFLSKAKEYGVEKLIAFTNSPPVYFTKNGRANSDNTDQYGNSNLKDEHYIDFANFLATVLHHFDTSGTPFDIISPVNEPQYKWADGQEGCPYKNMEIKKLTDSLNKALVAKGVDTKILIGEAGSYKYLYQHSGDQDKSNQIWKFFSPDRPEYIGNNERVIKGISGHSYWTDKDNNMIKTVRTNAYNKAKQHNINLYQTEYSMLGVDKESHLENALHLAKIIYSDLTIANASCWSYWTALARERWGHKNRFYLIRIKPGDGDYGTLTKSGTHFSNTNLWVIGNYSMFIRPGYQRVNLAGANDLNNLMGSAYLSPDTSRLVMVYVNVSDQDKLISHTLNNLPEKLKVKGVKIYITNASNNLKKVNEINIADQYTIPKKSVVTMVTSPTGPEPGTVSNEIRSQKRAEPTIYIDQTTNMLHIKSKNQEKKQIKIFSRSGKLMTSKALTGQTFSMQPYPRGIYIVSIGTPGGVFRKKIIKIGDV